MLALLVVAAVAVPIAELWLMIEVGQRIGVAETFLVVVALSVVGVWLVRRQGLGVLARIRDRTAAGQVPAVELVDGAMLLVAGLLLLVPGFLTDAVGLVLLVPPVRAAGRRAARRVLGRRAAAVLVVRRLR